MKKRVLFFFIKLALNKSMRGSDDEQGNNKLWANVFMIILTTVPKNLWIDYLIE